MTIYTPGFESDLLIATNVDFSHPLGGGSSNITTLGELLMGSGQLSPLPEIVPATLVAGAGVSITPALGPNTITIALTGGGLAIDQIAVDAATGPGVTPVDPTAAGLVTINALDVAAQSIPIRTHSIALNQLQVEAQISSASALDDLNQNGLAHFNSAHFTVTAGGFVSNLNGLPATAFDVQFNTAPGTDPVLPNASGVVSVSGAIDVAGGQPMRTDSIVANSYFITAQASSAQALSNLNDAGMASFNSAHFTVDVNGFVSAIAAPFVWQDFAPGALAIQNGYFATGAGAYTLPLGVLDGEMVEIVDQVGGGVVVTAAGAQIIQISNVLSSAGGTATSTQSGDALRLIFRATNSTWVCVPGAAGNWILA